VLEEKSDYSVCGVCFGVMVEPASGCPEGHSFCRGCFVKVLRDQNKCPTCRHPVKDERKLVRNRQLEGMISELKAHCEHAEGGKGKEAAGPSAAKRAKLAPAASMTAETLKKELLHRGLETVGNKAEMEARLEEDRKQGAGCKWKGRVGGLAAHLLECQWVPVKCPNEGCTESPPRKDLAEHEATCGMRKVKCAHCEGQMEHQLLAEHEGSCPRATIECPNEGCCHSRNRGFMNLHLEICEHAEVACPYPGCDARLPCKGLDAHMQTSHPEQSPATLLLRAYSRIASLEAAASERAASRGGVAADVVGV